MGDSRSFHIGNVSGGQNNLGGDHNEFHQSVQHGVDPAVVAELLATMRRRLDDFTDPEAAARALTVVEGTPVGELTRREKAVQAVRELMGYVRPGTEAVTAVTALATAIRGVVG